MARSMERRLQTLAPLPENLFVQPLEYLRADHFRLETLGRLLADANTAGGNGAMTAHTHDTLLAFLEVELPRHMNDEEDDLFPLIGAHCPDTSPLHPLVGLLKDMHDRLDSLRAELADGLRVALDAGDAPNGRRFWQTARAFGELLHWNITIENRVVLPSAGACLATPELDFLGHAMAARRQVTYPSP